MSGVGSSSALATCETSQVLLAGVSGGFSRGSPVFGHLPVGPSHMNWNNLGRDVKLNLKKNHWVPLASPHPDQTGHKDILLAKDPNEKHKISRVMRKATIWLPNKSDTNQAVQAQKMTRCWTFWI